MTGATRRRGEPLAVLGAVLAGWVALRMVLWEPAGVPAIAPDLRLAGPETVLVVSSARDLPVALSTPERKSSDPVSFVPGSSRHCSSLQPGCATRPAQNGVAANPVRAAFITVQDQAAPVLLPREPMLSPQVAAGHQLMMLAALGHLPLPQSLAASLARTADLPNPLSTPRPSRWSGDGWALLRRGSDGRATAPSFARYGASQAGAVLRYSLAPASAVRPQAHFRLTRALVGSGESEAALGLSLRPPRASGAALW